MIRRALSIALLTFLPLPAVAGDIQTDRDIPVPMRDGVVLRADIYRPATEGPFPVLVYRTPYGKRQTAEWYDTHLAAVARGYAVVIQDVRGRYSSEGIFYPYLHEGRDGFDTIEWAARQAWSNGEIGTYGLSYPGAVQWLAAMERPPHLKAMVPAMTFATPQRFFYFNGVFDLSWLPWIHNSIVPDARVRQKLSGARTVEEARADWSRNADRMRQHLPLLTLPDFQETAPYYYDWLRHPPTDAWWSWAELGGRYDRVEAAVLNLSGWHDEAYGPDGATMNFNGLLAARTDDANPRTRLIMGPWVHGVKSVRQRRTGDIDFGPDAAIDYNEVVLRWMDRHVRGLDTGTDEESLVRFFVMGDNRWRDASSWPPTASVPMQMFLNGPRPEDPTGTLGAELSAGSVTSSRFVSDPTRPLTDPHSEFGPHDYSSLAQRTDLVIFDSAPLADDLEVTGVIESEIFVSCDCTDLDLWVRILDVGPDGTAFNLMSPGLDVQRASYRDPDLGRQLLEPGEIYNLRFPRLVTSNVFGRGHRIRLQISGAFFPHFSRNPQTGESETDSARLRAAEITLHHGPGHPSRLLLPVIPAR